MTSIEKSNSISLKETLGSEKNIKTIQMIDELISDQDSGAVPQTVEELGSYWKS